MNPLFLAAAVAGGVYLLTRGATVQTGPGGLPLPSPGAGTVPDTGSSQPGTSPPGGEIGGVPHDPGQIPGELGNNGSGPCKTCSGGSGFPSATVMPQKPLILTAPPPSRDHRGEKPRTTTVTVRPRPSTTQVACIRAPCPSSPTSGKTDPHSTSYHIQARLAGGPIIW